jgi:predicted Rossmann fold nucleotide-binding protein DprA/Smf involved in DNA uptake
MFVTEEGLMPAAEMNLRLLALCSIDGVNWNVIAREALRSGGLARLLAGTIEETSRDADITRRQLAAQLPTLEERVGQARNVVATARDKVNARLVTVLDRAEYPSNLRVIPSPPPFLRLRPRPGERKRAAPSATRVGRVRHDGRRR